MQIYFSCPECKSRLEVDASAADTCLTCPHCRQPIAVPSRRVGSGLTIGGFRIQKLLGRGGMGEVYVAWQTSMGREVALKILPVSHSARKDLVERFINEVRMAARMEHPNIVTAYEAGEDEGILYLAMAYVRGQALSDVLLRDGALAEARALRIALKVAEALAYAWDEHRMLHRDIKPANIILDRKDEPKLLDMGLSKSLREPGDPDMTDVILGTPNYMSPEQADGALDLDYRSDMYALGMTLWHMVTGQLPYKDMKLAEILRRKAGEDLPDPRKLNPKVSADTAALLRKMLARNPEQRPATWADLINELQEALARLEEQEAQAPGTTLFKRWGLRRGRKQRRRWAWRIGMAGLLLIIIALLATPNKKRETAPRAAAASAAALLEPAPAPTQEPPLAAEPEPAPAPAPAIPETREPEAPETAPGPEISARPEPAAPPAQPARGPAPEVVQAYAGRVAQAVLAWNLPQALALADAATRDPDLARSQWEWPTLADEIRQLQRIPDLVAESFSEQVGQTITLALRQGPEEWEVRSRDVRTIRLRRHVGSGFLEKTITPEDLSLTETVQRLSYKYKAEAAIFLGVQSSRAGKPQAALASFEAGASALGRLLAEDARRRINLSQEELARQGLHRLIQLARLPEVAATPEALLQALRQTRYTPEELARLQENVRQFRATFGASESAYAYAAFLDELGGLREGPRNADPAALEKILAALKAANPNLDEVTAGYFQTPDGLELNLSQNPGLRDITPLMGYPCQKLDLGGTQVGNLAPLRGMRLASLVLAGCPVEDLRPLSGMPLENLNLEGCRVSELLPLRFAPLRSLNLAHNPVARLNPLHDMPLTNLNLMACPVEDLRPLRNLPLQALNLSWTAVSDLRPLEALPLEALDLRGAWRIADLAPLAGMTHLVQLGWEDWQTSTLLFRMTKALERGDYDGAIKEARETVRCYAQVPALRDLLRQVLQMAEVRIPDWQRLMERPRRRAEEWQSLAQPFEGRRFLLYPAFMAWPEARLFAERQGGRLAVIRTPEEQAWIAATFGTPGVAFWLGASDQAEESRWQWLDGRPFLQSNWAPGEPNDYNGKEDFLAMQASGLWNDLGGEVRLPLLIQWNE